MRLRFLILTAVLLMLGHWALRTDAVSWLPLPITAAAIIAFTAKQPLRYLVGLAVVSEVLSTLPGGIVALVVLFPWLVQKLVRHREQEAWMAWLAVIVATVLGQLLILAQAWTWAKGWQYVPWPAVGITWLASSLVISSIAARHRLFMTPAYER